MNKTLVLSSLMLWTSAALSADDDWLEQIRQKHAVPAIAAAAMREGALVTSAATGTREFGGSEPVTLEDLWHIGSCTKSMTATLAGIMHDEGKVRWEMKIGEVLPHLLAAI